MIKNNEVFSVLTGDIVNSSKLNNQNRARLPEVLKKSFSLIKKSYPGNITYPFDIFRGDSFQGVLKNPTISLKAALQIRTRLIFEFSNLKVRGSVDVRIAIGIGTIDFLPKQRTGSLGDGQAFKLSGIGLDKMKKSQRLIIRTPWSEIDEEFDAECALLDGLANRWSPDQAEAILQQLQGLNQGEIARKLNRSQPAIVSRLKIAGGWAVEAFCKRFEVLLQKKLNISPRDYNG